MVSGWEKSPDYGTPEPPPWFWILIAVVLIAIIGGVIWIANL